MQFIILKKLQSLIKQPILIKKKENLLYLTGEDFSRAEGFLLVIPARRHSERSEESKLKGSFRPKGLQDDATVFFGSGLEKISGVKNVDRLKNIGKYLKGQKQLDIEYGFTYGEGEFIKLKVKSLKLKVASEKFKVKPVKSPVDVIRQVKDVNELACIRKSMQIVAEVFKLVRKEIKKQGMTEIKLAKFIESSGLKMGAENVSFPAIVASGPNAAIPHHVPSAKKLKQGESIILDFGFKYENYCSDFTRTVFLKTAPKKLAEAYIQTEKAYNESIAYAKAGVKAGDVYQKSVEVLAEKKLEKYFIHSLGHGTGLEIHELPNVSPNSKDILQNGMVFSMEPGVYFPKTGGIRIEDLVYLEEGKVKKFINVSTKLGDNIL